MYYSIGCDGVKDLNERVCQAEAHRCTEPDIRKVCPQTCGDCGKFQIKFYFYFDGKSIIPKLYIGNVSSYLFSIVCEDIYQTPYCQMLAKADYAAGCTTKCCGKLTGNDWNIQGTQEDIRKILKKECYKTCEYCGKDIYLGHNCLKLKYVPTLI